MPVIFDTFYLGPNAASAIGGTGTIQVNICNESDIKLEEQRLEVQETAYWQPRGVDVPSVAPGQTQSVRLALWAYASPDARPHRVPETVSVKLSKSGQQYTISLVFSFFVNGLKRYSPEGLPGANGCKCFNVLVFGLAGSGKSSTINSMFTLMSEPSALPSTRAMTSSLMSTTTAALEAYPIPGLPLTMRDTWGSSDTTYSRVSKTFHALLHGFLPSSWKMEDKLEDNVKELQAGQASTHFRRIHAVIFFINAATISSADEREMAIVRENLLQLQSLQYKPMVVLSRYDGYTNNSEAFEADTLGQHVELNDLKKQAAEALGTTVKDVTVGYNYVKQDRRDFQVDRVTYTILEMALHRAEDFCRRDRPLPTLEQVLKMPSDPLKYQSQSSPAEKEEWVKKPDSHKWH